MSDIDNSMPLDHCDALLSSALDTISRSETRLSPAKLIFMIMESASVTRARAKQVIRLLADRGDIVYTNFFGSTYLEPSFLKPVLIADHYILKPWDAIKTPDAVNKSTIEIIISPGIAFGSGSHPTTRICLQAMAFVFFAAKNSEMDFLTGFSGKECYAADVGTGSGVLAIAAVKSGIKGCLAIDTDINCVSEASANVKLNGLEDKIVVTDAPVDRSQNRFSLIIANLRYPTLKKMSHIFRELTENKACLILSGVREWESKALISCYLEKGFHCLWQKDEKKWSGMVFIKK